jgi:cell division septation protein DedD
MSNASVNVKNLEQIQEMDPQRSSSKLSAVFLASLAGAALVIAFVLMAKREGPPAQSHKDPLQELLQKTKHEAPPPHQLTGSEVTFPEMLSDDEHATTALAAVKDERGRLVEQRPGADDSGSLIPPPAADRLPVAPLPAGDLLSATPVTNDPKDPLSRLAVSAARDKEAKLVLAPAGSDAGFQLQVASFKEQDDADRFVEQLRKRGHQAFRIAAMIPGRGLWHRVRVGPFENKYQAVQYKQKFETSERLAPFIVDPEKVKQAEEVRERKLQARIERFGRP